MKFVNFVKYSDLQKIAGARPAHFAYADRLREDGKLAIGGPLTDDQGRRIGLLFIYEGGSRDEALHFAEEDPFTVAGALSSSEISEWRPRFMSSDLLVKAHRAAHQNGEQTDTRLFANYAKYGTDLSRLTTVRPAHWEYDRTLESGGTLALAVPSRTTRAGFSSTTPTRGTKRCRISSKTHSLERRCSQSVNSTSGSSRASILTCSPYRR
jgi:uncharacterized protein YciI